MILDSVGRYKRVYRKGRLWPSIWPPIDYGNHYANFYYDEHNNLVKVEWLTFNTGRGVYEKTLTQEVLKFDKGKNPNYINPMRFANFDRIDAYNQGNVAILKIVNHKTASITSRHYEHTYSENGLVTSRKYLDGNFTGTVEYFYKCD